MTTSVEQSKVCQWKRMMNFEYELRSGHLIQAAVYGAASTNVSGEFATDFDFEGAIYNPDGSQTPISAHSEDSCHPLYRKVYDLIFDSLWTSKTL
jgi:hypothetical protein